MSTLDYLELPSILNDMSAQITENICEIEKKLEEKAKYIASRNKSDSDHVTRLKLKEEQKHIIQVALTIDLMKNMMRFFQSTVNNTNADFWAIARDGGELKEKIKFMQDTISILNDRESTYLNMLKEKNGVNKR